MAGVMTNQHYRADSYKARSSIGYLVKRSHGLMHDNIEPAFAEHGFTFMQWVVMMYLRDGIALNPKDICSEFRHDSGALTRVLDQLAERGLVERQRSVTDRRKVDLKLTKDGRKTVESLIPIVVDGLNGALTDFTPTEFAELTRLLIKLNEGMAALQAAGDAQ
jgi:DNA-binding MarR family transcriptional regulator